MSSNRWKRILVSPPLDDQEMEDPVRLVTVSYRRWYQAQRISYLICTFVHYCPFARPIAAEMTNPIPAAARPALKPLSQSAGLTSIVCGVHSREGHQKHSGNLEQTARHQPARNSFLHGAMPNDICVVVGPGKHCPKDNISLKTPREIHRFSSINDKCFLKEPDVCRRSPESGPAERQFFLKMSKYDTLTSCDHTTNSVFLSLCLNTTFEGTFVLHTK